MKLKQERLSKILGYMPSEEQFKAIEKLFRDYRVTKVLREIATYPTDGMLGIQDTLFIKRLQELVSEISSKEVQ